MLMNTEQFSRMAEDLDRSNPVEVRNAGTSILECCSNGKWRETPTEDSPQLLGRDR